MKILNQHYSITADQIEFYRKNGYIKLKQVLDKATIDHFNMAIGRKVEALNNDDTPLEERDTYGRAFVQIFNLWRLDEDIKELVFSKRLAGIARDLMEVDGVRIYHDQALFKEAGGGITPWHADQYYWPLASDRTITVWIPLQETPLEMGPLEFSAGSHSIVEGRELNISDESERVLSKRLRIKDLPHVIEAFDLGEVSFHSGWVFHRAGANDSEMIRKVMTVIYMDKDMVLKKPENKNQINDWNTWCPGARVGEVIETEMNPILVE
ncbi:MAG: phytanoyl-CoA dioxygenase family protein [Bacteroidota bacterium]